MTKMRPCFLVSSVILLLFLFFSFGMQNIYATEDINTTDNITEPPTSSLDYPIRDADVTTNDANIRIISYRSPPDEAIAGNSLSFEVQIRNYGDVEGTVKMEGAVIPIEWVYSSISPECCYSNKFYEIKEEVTVGPFESKYITFTITAPDEESVDVCNNNDIYPRRSAWGNSFAYRVGIYEYCSKDYIDHFDIPGPLVCTYDPICTDKDKTCINNDKTIQNWHRKTLCRGGCGDWIEGSTENCPSDHYCIDSGTAYCEKCSTSCDKICKSPACYETDPDCAADGSLKDCFDGSCDGKITTIVKDNKGNSIQGIRVYLDGTYKGTTDSAGEQRSSVSASYCGKSYDIGVYCSDGTFCGSGSTRINYDNDKDTMVFNCQVCIPLPDLLIDVQAQSSYELAEDITLNIIVKDDSGNLISDVYVKVCDPFDEIGCPSQYYHGYTYNGKILHISKATKIGTYVFDISATKDNYNSGETKKIITVGNFDGKIYVSVKDSLSKKPIYGASVYLDDSYKGKTNSYGRRTLYPQSPGNHEVKVNCPSGKLCSTKSIYLVNWASLDFSCDCTVPVGDLKVEVVGINNYPVANVYAFLDSVQTDEYITNAFGYTYFAGITQGEHEITIMYNITNENYYGIYAQTKTVDISGGENILKFTIDPSNAVPLAMNCSESAEPEIAPAVVLVAALYVVDVISVGISIEEYCKCISETETGLCVSAITECVKDNDIKYCLSGVLEDAVDKTGNCKLEAAFLIGDAVSPLVPVGIVGHFAVYAGKKLKVIDKFADGKRILYDPINEVWTYTKNTWDETIEYFTKWIDGIFKKVIVKGTSHWPDDSLKGIEYIAAGSGGKDGAEKFINSMRDEFGEEYAKKRAARVAHLAEDFGDDTVKKLLKSDIGTKALKEWDDDEARGLAKTFTKYSSEYIEKLKYRFGEPITKTTMRGIDANVIDIENIDPNKLAKYVKITNDMGIADPITDIGQHQLLKMIKSSDSSMKTVITEVKDGKIVKVYGEIDRVTILKMGTQEWGWEHILFKHESDIKNAFDLTDNNAIKNLIKETVEKGKKSDILISDGKKRINYEFEKTLANGDKRKMRVSVSAEDANFGSITTAYPI